MSRVVAFVCVLLYLDVILPDPLPDKYETPGLGTFLFSLYNTIRSPPPPPSILAINLSLSSIVTARWTGRDNIMVTVWIWVIYQTKGSACYWPIRTGSHCCMFLFVSSFFLCGMFIRCPCRTCPWLLCLFFVYLISTLFISDIVFFYRTNEHLLFSYPAIFNDRLPSSASRFCFASWLYQLPTRSTFKRWNCRQLH